KTTISGVQDPILARHRAAFDRGEITSWEDLRTAEEGKGVGGITPDAKVRAAPAAESITATSGPLESGESPVETPVEPGTVLDKVGSSMSGILSLLEPDAPPTAAGFMAQPGP